jgi:hypothetical protein
MTPASAAANIADTLREILARGLDLSSGTLRFIDSTFSQPSAAELAEILRDETAAERDSLLELLFSPDEALQIELEPQLTLPDGGGAAEEEVAARLAAAAPTVTFRFPDGRGELAAALTEALACRLVRGLGIGRKLPASAAEAIEAVVPEHWRRYVRVGLRNARFDFTPPRTEFLCALIAKLDFQGDDGRQCFAFALELLAELGASGDIWELLAARKKWLSQALHHGRRLREHLSRSNIETLLSQGQRLTWVDETTVRRQMGFIDRVCLAAFGAVAHVDSDLQTQVVELDGQADVAAILRSLS